MYVQQAIAAALIVVEQLGNFYSHAIKVGYRVLLPELQREKIYCTCRKMCEELITGCTFYLEENKYYIVCSWFEETQDPNIN